MKMVLGMRNSIILKLTIDLLLINTPTTTSINSKVIQSKVKTTLTRSESVKIYKLKYLETIQARMLMRNIITKQTTIVKTQQTQQLISIKLITATKVQVKTKSIRLTLTLRFWLIYKSSKELTDLRHIQLG